MWKIERFINDRRQQLSDNEPLKGHEERFMTRLRQEDSPKKDHGNKTLWFGAAASLVFVFTVVWLSPDPFKSSHALSLSNVTAIEIPEELTQVLGYYDDQIESDTQELISSGWDSKSQANINEVARKQIDKLNSKLMNIEKEYTKNPGSKAVKAAMVNTQRKKAEIVSHLNITSQAAAQGYRVGEPYTQF